MPTPIQGNSPHQGRSRWPANGNSAPWPSSSGRQVTDTVQAAMTGIRLRGFHSNSRSSTASSTAAIGVPKIAVMPAAAPATSRVLRSAALRLKHCANSEPRAPPVMMIGPSAPNGPPVPIEIAEDSGLRIGDFRLHAAAADQDRLDGFGNAVAADLLGAKARHQPDGEAADRRRQRPSTGWV